MLRGHKESVVGSVRTDFERSQGVLFLDFTGLTVAEADAFRRKLQVEVAESRYVVVKNTLIKRALADKPYESVSGCLSGTPTGVLFGFEDPVSAPKLLFDFIKDCPHLRVKGGILDDKAIDATQAEALAKMPSKEEMQASIVALALSPGRMLAAQLKSPAGRIVGAIEALAERLEKSEAA